MRLLLKRAGHELRNAQNAAAVNLEVVRSRIAAGKTEKGALQSFADNAARGLEDSARLGEAVVTLCSAAVSALAQGDLIETAADSGAISLELRIARESAERLVSGLEMLASRAGFTAEAAGAGVILRIPPENETNRA
jgi:hypothetical protein